MRRGRRSIPTTPEGRTQRRLSELDGRPEPWRSGPIAFWGSADTATGAFGSGGVGASIARNGVGDVTISWTPAFESNPIVLATAYQNTVFIKVQAVTTTTARIQTFSGAGAAFESPFMFAILAP